MDKIVVEVLKLHGACSFQRDKFISKYPDGFEVSPESLREARDEGFSLIWFIEEVLERDFEEFEDYSEEYDLVKLSDSINDWLKTHELIELPHTCRPDDEGHDCYGIRPDDDCKVWCIHQVNQYHSEPCNSCRRKMEGNPCHLKLFYIREIEQK